MAKTANKTAGHNIARNNILQELVHRRGRKTEEGKWRKAWEEEERDERGNEGGKKVNRRH